MLNARLAFVVMLASSNQVQLLGRNVDGLVIGSQAGIRFLGTIWPRYDVSICFDDPQQ